MTQKIFQILSITGLSTTGLLAAASVLHLVAFDIALAYALLTFAVALEICRTQYLDGGEKLSMPRPRQITASTQPDTAEKINIPVAA